MRKAKKKSLIMEYVILDVEVLPLNILCNIQMWNVRSWNVVMFLTLEQVKKAMRERDL